MARKKLVVDSAPDLGHILESLRPLAVPIGDVNLDPRNAKTHDDNSLHAIATSLRDFGQRKPIVANRRTKLVTAGNGTLEAARRLGWKWLAVAWTDDDDGTAAAFAVADNMTAEFSQWNPETLDDVLRSVGQASPELESLFADLAAREIPEGPPEIRVLEIRPPPVMTWALVGIPTVRFGEISEAIERIAALPGAIVETTANDG